MYHKTSHSYIIVIKFNTINISLFAITLHYSTFETLFLLHLIMHSMNIKLFPFFKKFQNIFPVSVIFKKSHIKNLKNMWENKMMHVCYDNHLQNWEMQTVFYFFPEIKKVFNFSLLFYVHKSAHWKIGKFPFISQCCCAQGSTFAVHPHILKFMLKHN
jgi:hypothetical protein